MVTQRKPRVSTTCLWCGEVTLRLPCFADRKFCNTTCANRFLWSQRERKTQEVSCGSCGKMFCQNISGQKYCSPVCGDEGRKAAARVELTCSYCEGVYWRHRGKSITSKYCSLSCKNSAGAERRAAREMSPEEYQYRLAEQGGVCALRKRPDDRLNLARDHFHKTGAWRGLLCGRCNKALGLFRDDPELLRAAAEYVERGGVQLASAV